MPDKNESIKVISGINVLTNNQVRASLPVAVRPVLTGRPRSICCLLRLRRLSWRPLPEGLHHCIAKLASSEWDMLLVLSNAHRIRVKPIRLVTALGKPH